MRFALLLVLILLAGCENIVGPFRKKAPDRVDDPRLTIPEQEKLGRTYLSLPDESNLTGPHSGAVRPGLDANR
jgi:hypothetical protein